MHRAIQGYAGAVLHVAQVHAVEQRPQNAAAKQRGVFDEQVARHLLRQERKAGREASRSGSHGGRATCLRVRPRWRKRPPRTGSSVGQRPWHYRPNALGLGADSDGLRDGGPGFVKVALSRTGLLPEAGTGYPVWGAPDNWDG